MSELRCSDVPARNLEEFKKYIEDNSGPGKYFLDNSFQYEGQPVRLTYRTQADIMRYLLNYMGRDPIYNKLTRNCQFFAADFLGFIAGKKNIKPFFKSFEASYSNRSYLFLYNPSMYNDREDL